MPENFSSLLEALDTAGRSLARPASAAAIETLAKSRRSRRRFTTATSALVVCATAVGVTLGTGGAPNHLAPITPPSSTSRPSASSSHETPAPGAKNRVGAAALMEASEAPQPALFQWTRSVYTPAESPDFTSPSCDLKQVGAPTQSHAASSITAGYQSARDSSSGQETIYHYASDTAASKDYVLLGPDGSRCAGDHVTTVIKNGLAWESPSQGTGNSSLHWMMVRSGNDIATWFYDYPGGVAPYDTSDDPAALGRMAERLEGGTPTPDPVTTAPPGALPASAWLDAKQIPLATADESRGWVPMGTQQEAASGPPSANLCEAITDGSVFVGDAGATIRTRSFHGSPPNTPVYSGSTYLYSGADEHIVTFPNGPAQAQAAFGLAEQVTALPGCQFTDGSGPTTRTIKVGKKTLSGFSLLATDTPGPGYDHLYCVVKDSYVAWMLINFERGDTSTAGDAAVLDAMASRLP